MWWVGAQLNVGKTPVQGRNFIYLRDGYYTRKRTYGNPDRKDPDRLYTGGGGCLVGLCDGSRHSGIRASDGIDGDEQRAE